MRSATTIASSSRSRALLLATERHQRAAEPVEHPGQLGVQPEPLGRLERLRRRLADLAEPPLQQQEADLLGEQAGAGRRIGVCRQAGRARGSASRGCARPGPGTTGRSRAPQQRGEALGVGVVADRLDRALVERRADRVLAGEVMERGRRGRAARPRRSRSPARGRRPAARARAPGRAAPPPRRRRAGCGPRPPPSSADFSARGWSPAE